MAKIKLEHLKMDTPEKINLARYIISKMTKNPNFKEPVPYISELKNKSNELEMIHKDVQHKYKSSQNTFSLQENVENELDSLLTKLAAHIETVSKGNTKKIKSTGMQLRGNTSHEGQINAPLRLFATAGDFAGEINLLWEPARSANFYKLEISSNSNDISSVVKIVSKSNYSVNGLKSGLKYRFRVAVINSTKQGSWSHPVSKYAP